MPRVMYDSTSAADYPDGGDVVLAYADGRYANGPALARRFPTTPQMSCAVFASTTGAQCYDIEPSCIWPPEEAVPAILRREREAGRWPILYVGGRANWRQVINAVDAAGLVHPPYIVAHYTNVAHFCDSSCYSVSVGVHVAAGTQYGGDLVGHYDVSILADHITGFDGAEHPLGGGTVLPAATPEPTVQEDDDMQLIQGETRGIALVGAGYFRQLTDDEEVRTATAMYGMPKIRDDRGYDVAKALVLGGRPDDFQVAAIEREDAR